MKPFGYRPDHCPKCDYKPIYDWPSPVRYMQGVNSREGEEWLEFYCAQCGWSFETECADAATTAGVL